MIVIVRAGAACGRVADCNRTAKVVDGRTSFETNAKTGIVGTRTMRLDENRKSFATWYDTKAEIAVKGANGIEMAETELKRVLCTARKGKGREQNV